MPRQHTRIADQLDTRILADPDAPQLGFLEIALDAVRVRVDQRKDGGTGIDVTAGQETEICDDTVHGRDHRRTLEIEIGDLKGCVRRVEFRLIDVDRLLPLLDLLDGNRDAAQGLAALEIALGLIERGLPARGFSLRLIERILKAP